MEEEEEIWAAAVAKESLGLYIAPAGIPSLGKVLGRTSYLQSNCMKNVHGRNETTLLSYVEKERKKRGREEGTCHR